MKSSTEPRLWGVILAGGIGSRFWPASTPRRPKQLLHLATAQPLIRDTVERIEPLIPRDRLRILTGESLATPIAQTLDGFGDEHFFIEPRAAGTGPVLTWAAARIHALDPDAVMVSLHADHVIEPADTFREQVLHAARLATEHRRLFTIGAVPDRPETGYGYIRQGKPLGSDEFGAREVDSFVEKPNAETAARYVADGNYLWNTGIFVWRVADLLAQVEQHTPEIRDLLPLLENDSMEEFFAQVPNVSIDEGVLERSDAIGVLPSRFRWDDIGAWDSVYRTKELDTAGNALIGDAYAVDTQGSVVYADDGPVVTFGVEDLVIVKTGGVTFVTHRDRSADLKTLLEQLPEQLRRLD